MTTKLKYAKLFTTLLLVIYLLTIIVIPTLAYAESENNFDSTSALDDLRSSTVDGKPFNINAYPFDSTGTAKKPSIINFVEYCYSFKANMQGNFGLYLYFYNPQVLELDTENRGNKIQLAVKYDSDGVPTDYEKFDLQFCSVSTEPNYYRLFYKFKIIDRKGIDGKTILQRVNSNERKYDISGVELVTKGSPNAVDYSVGGTYKFTGFAKGYGADKDAESNLRSTVIELETISLDVRSTNFRTSSSSFGKDHQNQLDSVYFSVDNEVLKKYGKLQKVKAEWYEYKTAPIVVTQDKAMYDVLSGYVGIDNGEHSDGLPYKLGYNRNVISSQYSTIINYEWSYNVRCYSNIGLSTFVVNSKDKCNLLPYLFYTGGTNVKDYTLSSETLKQWIHGYNKSAIKGYLPIKNGNISADLFLDNVDANRKKGYNCVEIDSSEKYDLLSYTSNHGFWDKVGDYGFWATVFGKVPTDENVFGIEPIYDVKDKDVSYDSSGIANSLLISPSDVDAFKDYYSGAKAKNKTTFLFRFAVTDYFSGILSAEKTGQEMLIKDKSYMAKETIFMDFDVIQLTFNKDGAYHVIPVVSNPIDIVGAITPPIEFEGNDWWKLVLGIILLVLLLILLFPVLPWIIKGVWWLIRLPFKAIKSIFKGISKGFKKKSSKRKEKVIKNVKVKVNEKDKVKKNDRVYFEGDWLPNEAVEDIKKERYMQIMREDFPNDFYDDMDIWEDME